MARSNSGPFPPSLAPRQLAIGFLWFVVFGRSDSSKNELNDL